MFQVTGNSKIGTVGRFFFFFFLLKILNGVNRKTIWPIGEIPTQSLKIFRVSGEKLGMVG